MDTMAMLLADDKAAQEKKAVWFKKPQAEIEKNNVAIFLKTNEHAHLFPFEYIINEHAHFNSLEKRLHLEQVEKFINSHDWEFYKKSELPEQIRISFEILLYGCYALLKG